MEHRALAEHGEQLKSLAAVLHSDATRQFGVGGWSSLYVDIRVPSGGTSASTVDIAIVDGQRTRLQSSGDAASVIVDLVAARESLPGAPWFGCVISVTVDGECDVKYDYDETCLERLLDDHY